MMSDGILSQDEIDALIGESDRGGDTAVDLEAIGEVLRIAMDAGVEGLADLFAAEGSLTPGETEVGTPSGFLAQFHENAFVTPVTITGGVSGAFLYVLPEGAARTFREWTSDGHARAVDELGAQLVSALETILSTSADADVGEPVLVKPGRPGMLPVAADERVVRRRFSISLGSRTVDIDVLVAVDTAREILDAIAAHLEEADDDPSAGARGFEPSEDAPVTASVADTVQSGPDAKVRVDDVDFADLGTHGARDRRGNLDFLLDVPLEVTVELGRTQMLIKEILELGKGSVIELDKLAGEPVEIFVNGRLIAKGEVVTIDENFGVKITDIVSRLERVTNLQ